MPASTDYTAQKRVTRVNRSTAVGQNGFRHTAAVGTCKKQTRHPTRTHLVYRTRYAANTNIARLVRNM